MNELELINLLGSKETSSAKTRACPDENLFASYIHEKLSQEKKRELETHFADCDACLETVSILITTGSTPSELVPPALLVRARALAEPKPRFVWRWRWAFATASACVLVLAFGISRYRNSDDGPPAKLVAIKTAPLRTPIVLPSPTVTESTPMVQKPTTPNVHSPALRGAADTLKPVLVSPRNAGTLSSEQPTIRWKPVTDATFYEVTVVTTDGGHVLTQSTGATELSLHDQPVRAGEKYFVTVTAHLGSNRTVRSEPVSFHVISRP